MQDSFQYPSTDDKIKPEGKRQQLLRKNLYEIVSSQVCKDLHSSPPPVDYTSTTHKDYCSSEGNVDMGE